LAKIELKTGMQALGIQLTSQEFTELWKTVKKPVKKLKRRAKEGEVEPEETLSYFELLVGMNTAGCFKFQQSLDNTNNLIAKFRMQLKKRNISVEKAYKQFDPSDNKFVFLHDFTHECVMLGLEFAEEELAKIFEFICQVGAKGTESTDMQTQ
jgi:hypothetical protein